MPPPPHKGGQLNFQPDFSLKQNLFQLAAFFSSSLSSFLIWTFAHRFPSGRVLTPLVNEKQTLPPWLRLRPCLLHESVPDQHSPESLFRLHSISALFQNLTCNPYRLSPKLLHRAAQWFLQTRSQTEYQEF